LTRPGACSRGRNSECCDRVCSASWSSCSRNPLQCGVRRRSIERGSNAGTERKSRSVLRHCSSRSGSKRWFSIASTVSSSSPPTSIVVPKVPSFM
jgi:hypothetical protein